MLHHPMFCKVIISYTKTIPYPFSGHNSLSHFNSKPEGTDTSGEMRAYNEQLKKLSKAIKETEESLKKSATKEDIKELCSVSMVEEMIEEKIEKLSPQPPASKSLTKTPSATAEQPAKRKESRSKLFQEVTFYRSDLNLQVLGLVLFPVFSTLLEDLIVK